MAAHPWCRWEACHRVYQHLRRDRKRLENRPESLYSLSSFSRCCDPTFQMAREQIEAGVDYVVEMRYRNDVEPTYELEVTAGKHKNKTLDVVAVIYEPSVGKPRETHVFCKYKAS